MSMRDIKSILKKYRLKKGLSQQRLADLLDVNRVVIANWESGDTRIPIDMADKALSILGVSLRIGADPEDWKTERL